jgi:phosphatidylserine synthase
MSCALIRLARFNVSNKHGEQHHFSFLGLPSPGAGGAVAALVLMQQDLQIQAAGSDTARSTASIELALSNVCLWLIPALVLATGLLMVSHVRYPHLVNRYLRGKRSLGRLVFVLMIVLAFVVAHRYALGIGMLIYVAWGVTGSSYLRLRRRPPAGAALPAAPAMPAMLPAPSAPAAESPGTGGTAGPNGSTTGMT